MKKTLIVVGIAALVGLTASADEFVEACTANKPDAQSEEQASAFCVCLAEQTEDTLSVQEEIAASGKVDDLDAWLAALSEKAQEAVKACLR